MNNYKPTHIPVLKEAVLKYALPDNAKIFVDGTFGLGGHSSALLAANPSLETCIGIDRDAEILEYSCQTATDQRIKRFQANASDLPGILALENIKGVDGILLDLGVSSHQLDKADRGFSFSKSGPLDMRMDRSSELSAEEIVNTWEKQELQKIFKVYGEEKFSGRIAQAIIQARSEQEITDTKTLAEIISNAIPAKFRKKSKIHPATRVFQAIRIAVNEELKELEDFLSTALECLNPGGHLTLISFHSLEDRIVKKFFNENKTGCKCPPNFPVCVCNQKPKLKVLTRKPVIATEEEARQNPRARSAKLRSAQKL